jgi:aspartokinase
MKIGGIIENRELTLYRINALQDEPGRAGTVLNSISEGNINFEYITESSCEGGRAILAFCVHSSDIDKVDKRIAAQKEIDPSLRFIKTEGVCVLGIYGPHFREKNAIASTYFKLLGNAGINILGVSSSISSVCCVIEEKNLDKAREAILSFYELP